MHGTCAYLPGLPRLWEIKVRHRCGNRDDMMSRCPLPWGVMHVYLCVRVRICVCMCARMCAHTGACVRVCACVLVCAHVCAHVCARACVLGVAVVKTCQSKPPLLLSMKWVSESSRPVKHSEAHGEELSLASEAMD